MQPRLVLLTISFHAFNAASLIAITRVWRHRYAEEPAIRPRAAQLGTDLSVLSLVAGLSAVVFGAVAGEDASGIVALGSQWLFAEALLVLTMTAALVRRLRVSTVRT